MPRHVNNTLTFEQSTEYVRLADEAKHILGGLDELAEVLRVVPLTLRKRLNGHGDITMEFYYAMKWVHHLVMIKHAQDNRRDKK